MTRAAEFGNEIEAKTILRVLELTTATISACKVRFPYVTRIRFPILRKYEARKALAGTH